LVFGPLFNLQVGLGTHDRNSDGAQANTSPAQGSAALVAIGVPPLGLSYYRLRSTEVGAPGPAGDGQLGREREWRTLHTLTTHNVGVTVLQSVGERLTVGATAKLIVATAGSAIVDASGVTVADGLNDAEALGTTRHVRGDVDAGLMADFGRLRVGLVGRHLTAPEFDLHDVGSVQRVAGGTGTARLGREARLGLAWGSGWPGRARAIVALDADLTRRVTSTTTRRDVAAGVETWWRDARLGVRGGVRASTVGETRAVVTGGASLAVTAGIFVDGHVAVGQEDLRGWGVGARVVF
ncbi:MAG: conjugal transfer protein TraF, partial [Acidobacteria bacterium]|nr:conjugal transfer protein TraF [Acidobacteriota bacterium]